MNTPHPSDEQLSAALDGHDTGAAAHAAGCDACQQRLALLRTVIDAVAAPPPIDEVGRERALAAALGTAIAPIESIVLAPSRRRWRLSPGLGAAIGAAAVLLIAVLVGPALTGGSSHRNDTAARTTHGAGSAADEVAGPGAIDGGDLGAISDSQKLAAIVGPAIGTQFEASADSATGQSSKSGGAFASTTTIPAGGSQAPVAALAPAARPQRAGPFLCADAVAKDYSQGLGPLLYSATLTWQGEPAVVLAYALAQPTGSLDHRVFVMARSGCTLLTIVSL